MGVYIPNMEMPICCNNCRFAMHRYGICMADKKYRALATQGKTDYCPLVPVPPHGRLIDEQWLNMQIQTAKEIHENEKHDFCNAFDSNGRVCTEWWCVEDMLENAPTIIAASEEGEWWN